MLHKDTSKNRKPCPVNRISSVHVYTNKQENNCQITMEIFCNVNILFIISSVENLMQFLSEGYAFCFWLVLHFIKIFINERVSIDDYIQIMIIEVTYVNQNNGWYLFTIQKL